VIHYLQYKHLQEARDVAERPRDDSCHLKIVLSQFLSEWRYINYKLPVCKATRGFSATAELLVLLTKETICRHPDIW